VALAVHGGSKLHTLTPFFPDPAPLRDIAARIYCRAGVTRMLPILEHALKTERCTVVTYIGDAFEESRPRARQLADGLAANNTRLIILHDRGAASTPRDLADFFAGLVGRTEGALLPFDPSALSSLRELLQAVTVLAVGGTELLERKQAALPAAPLLLEYLSAAKRIGRR
jgi:hypothetical protein